MSNPKVNDVMRFSHWGRLTSAGKGSLRFEDLDDGKDVNVYGADLIGRAGSADYFETEETATKTQVAEILIQAHGKPFTVHFIKQDGNERTLRGRLVSAEPLLGRSHVEDLDIPRDKNRMRLVDHRTIVWLIIDNAKYVVKS